MRIIDIGAGGNNDKAMHAGVKASVFTIDAEHGCDLQAAVGDGSPGTFYVTADKVSSSILMPDAEALAPYKSLPHALQVVSTRPIKTVRLDNVSHGGADYIKLDCQGAEHLILSNAPETLRVAIGVTVEVLFGPMYRGQAYYGDVDRLMRTAGFRSCGLLQMRGDSIGGDMVPLWSDAMYIRDWACAKAWPPERRAMAARIAREVFKMPGIARLFT